MIIYLPKGARKLALRIKNIKDQSQLASFSGIQLLLQHGGQCGCDCWEGGSPWVLHGCWPGKITDVDIANPWRGPDIPILVYEAQELDADGRVVFYFDSKLDALPPGRYRATVQTTPDERFVFNPAQLIAPDTPPEKILPPGYETRGCDPGFPQPELPEPPKPVCILAVFDVDLGPSCGDHIVDQINMEYSMKSCMESCDGES